MKRKNNIFLEILNKKEGSRIVRRHVGTSLKDMGKKWFSILKMQETKAGDLGEGFRKSFSL